MNSASQNSSNIIFENVFFSFMSRSKKEDILFNFSFEVYSGEFIALIGPSGCGKTTTLRLASGLYNENTPGISLSGKRLLGGEIPLVSRKRHEISFIFQEPILMPWRTVFKNVELVVEIVGDVQDWPSPKDFLIDVDMWEYRDYFPDQLSGGMKQRVALARALASKPRFLFLDEPFGWLDDLTRESMDFYLLKLQNKFQVTTIFVTHNILEATLIADRIIRLTDKPSQTAEEIIIPFKKPRTKDILWTNEFTELIRKIKFGIG